MITITAALSKIFSQKEFLKEGKARQWKLRFKQGTLKLATQEEILAKFGYVKKKDSLWVKK